MTNGTSVEISYAGTELNFKPGSIYGGEVDFDCGVDRSIVYFLEALLVLAPFSKLAFRITLSGITADDVDQTIDGVKNANARILQYFGIRDGFDFQILRRGARPLGGGRVFFTCPVVSALVPVQQVDAGLIKKIRGVSSTTRVSPQISNRMIEAARSQLNTFIPDIYIYSDVFKGEDAGLSPGYSLFLQAESTTGFLLTADGVGVSQEPVEDMTLRVCTSLLRQIKRGGIVDQSHQWMVVLLMALCPDDLSKVVFGPLAEGLDVLLEDIKSFLGVSFKIHEDASGRGRKTMTLSCIGSGYVNLNRRTQ